MSYLRRGGAFHQTPHIVRADRRNDALVLAWPNAHGDVHTTFRLALAERDSALNAPWTRYAENELPGIVVPTPTRRPR